MRDEAEQKIALFTRRKRVDNKFMRGYYWLRGYVTCRIVLLGLSPVTREKATRDKLGDWHCFSFRNQRLYYSFQNGFNAARYGLSYVGEYGNPGMRAYNG